MPISSRQTNEMLQGYSLMSIYDRSIIDQYKKGELTMNKKLRGDLMLILAAMIWGSAFVAQKSGADLMGPIAFNGVRILIGGIVLLPVISIMDRIKGRQKCRRRRWCRYANDKGRKTCGVEKRTQRRHPVRACTCNGRRPAAAGDLLYDSRQGRFHNRTLCGDRTGFRADFSQKRKCAL